MHRLIRDHLEEVLAGAHDAAAGKHLKECGECRETVAAMRQQAALLRELRTPARQEIFEPRAGFYARVMESIESRSAASIWNVFFDSAFGRRIAIASLALALLLGVYLVTSEESMAPLTAAVQTAPLVAGPIPGEDEPGLVLAPAGAPDGKPDTDSVLVNLVTYREQ
jgi:predicted anti-sigma-YlaC factor YlaD